MSSKITSLDISGVLSALNDLRDDSGSVARTMAFESATAVRDSAKGYVRSKTGRLKGAIYAAYVPEESTEARHVYAVSWNKKKAPHGHLVEYGHWRTNVVVEVDGKWVFTKEKLDTPVRVPARPFLRPGYDSVKGRLVDVANKAGAERLAELRTRR
uniref:Capsid and scaffold protein n=1 Tax=Xanthomonas phage MK21 TaxID=3148942 RepID=A0AAU7J8B0_9CAUD